MTLEQAQREMERRVPGVNSRYKPCWHLSVPAGWHNDPNGFVFYQGRAHLFYQFHPYDSVWGPMHWGHWVSDDLVRWQNLPVAMAPDRPYDRHGCFSGTALETDGRLQLMYTGVGPDGAGRSYQQQCLASSVDGVRFEKDARNPVIGPGQLPPGASPYEFRDPKLEKTRDGWRAIAASQGENGGQLLAFRSRDLGDWAFSNVYLDELGVMAECPDVFELNGKTVVIVCVMCGDSARFGTPQAVVCLSGSERDDRLTDPSPMRLVDCGLDFYAPQTTRAPDGRRVLIGWALSWGHVMPTHTLGHGWAGMMTLPRECALDGEGRLCQQPLRELRKLRGSRTEALSVPVGERTDFTHCAGPVCEMEWTVDLRGARRFTLCLMQTGDEAFTLTYDTDSHTLTADRGRCGWPMTADLTPEAAPRREAAVPLRDGRLRLHIFVDVSIIEVFADEGRTVMTSLAFPKGTAYGVSARAQGRAVVEKAVAWHPDGEADPAVLSTE